MLSREKKLRQNLVSRGGLNDLEVKALENHLEVLVDSISLYNPNLEKRKPESFSLNEFREHLSTDSYLIRYYHVDDDIFRFSLNKEIIKLEKIPTSKIIKEVQEFRTALLDKRIEDAPEASIFLGEIPLETKHLIIIPEEELSGFPFEVLAHNNRVLMQSFPISYASDLVFVKNEDSKKIKGGIQAYVPTYSSSFESGERSATALRLDGAEEEGKWLSEHLNATLFSGKMADKETFYNESPSAGILHLSMHGLFEREKTALLMSNEEKLYLEELYGLRLSADLAVLGACNTAKSWDDEDRISSIHRAFLYSGVPATVASLWEVPDHSSGQILKTFYQELRQGATKDEALQKAKINYLESVKGSPLEHPYFWAGFVVYGDTSSLELGDNGVSYLWLLLPIGLLGFLWWSRRGK